MGKDSTVGNSYFNAKNQINKYSLDHSTFDLIDVDRFHNTDCSTVCSYLLTWILMFLSVALLGVDIYTCLNILVFHRWSTEDYKPYAYSVAKWIFTGCIIFQFCLLFYHWMWAIHTYKTRNIALAYVNNITRLLYVVRSYNYHCLFNKIEKDNFFDWACFLSYGEIDNALQILVADTPRQVINVLTLRNYATNDNTSNDIISNIKNIADTNVMLSVILSFMVLSLAIWSIFFFKFVFGMLLYIPVKVKLRKKKFKSLKKYCCSVVNEKVRILVFTNHKPKNELLEKGILDLNDINANPLLSSSTTTFQYQGDQDEGFVYRQVQHSGSQSSLSGPVRTDFKHGNSPYDSLPMDDLLSKIYHKLSIPRTGSNLKNVHYNELTSSFQDPFDDNQVNQGLMLHQHDRSPVRKPPPQSDTLFENPFSSIQDPPPPALKNPFNDTQESLGYEPSPYKLKHQNSEQTLNTASHSIDNDSYMTNDNQSAAITERDNIAPSFGKGSISVPPPAPTRPHRQEDTGFEYQTSNHSAQQLPSAFNSNDLPRSTSFASTIHETSNSASQHSKLSYPVSVNDHDSTQQLEIRPYPSEDEELAPYPVRGVSIYKYKREDE